MLRLGCILPKFSNICPNNSTTAEFNPFTESERDLWEKTSDDMVGGPSNLSSKQTVMGENFFSGFDKLVQIDCRN